jgi:hypothetical protein
MRGIYAIETYLNSKVNVEGNPNNNFFLYKNWILREKGIKILDNDFGKQEYLDEYIKDMHSIGWDQPVNLGEPIPRDELEEKLKEVVDCFGNVETILYQCARLEGRDGVAHRTIRDWPDMIGTVIFGEDYDPTKIKFKNFKYGSGEEQIVRWAALYYIFIKGE